MPSTEDHEQTRAGAAIWIAIVLSGLLALGSGWILVSGDWEAADPESVVHRIRASLVCGFSLLIFLLLFLPALRRKRSPEPGPLAAPWWTEPIGDATPDAVFIFDDQLLIRSANKGAEELFGYPVRELAGQSLFRLINATTQFSDARALEQTHDRKGMVLELTGRRRNGSELPVEFHVTHFERGSRGIYLAMCRERKPAAAGIRGASPEVDWPDRFITHAGKEIDTAVTTILGYSDVILGSLPGQSSNRGDVNQIRASGEHLAGLAQILQIVGRTPSKRGRAVDIHEWLRGLPETASTEGSQRVTLQLKAEHPVVRVETAYLGIVMARLLNPSGESKRAILVRTSNGPADEGRGLSIEVTRPASMPRLDPLTYELACGILGKTGCRLDAHEDPDGAVHFTVSCPLN